ncbi:MAG: transporter substrate-binding domain-containing protein [Bacteroidetes bacterium]|nr:transporter substrate-binding domain-containing protein [Bacteroidota bacterium]
MIRIIRGVIIPLLIIVQFSYVRSQTYVVGGDFDYPPFSYIDKTGNAKGVDIDILNAISEETGIKFDYKLSKWDSALNYIQTGKTDIIVGIIFSEEREAKLDFSNPLHTEYYSVFIRKELPLKELSDLYDYKLMALKEDISIQKFLMPMGLYTNFTVAKSLPEALAGVEWGRADYVIAPHSLGMNEIIKNKYENIEVKGPPIIPSIYCLAVKKGNTQLVGILNKGISDLRTNGKLAQIYSNWNFYERDEFKYKRIAKYIGLALLIVLALLSIVFIWIWSLRKQIKRKTNNISIKNRELQNLNAEKDKFLSIIAHDLRSPFNSIIGFSDLLVQQANQTESAKIVEYSELIRNSSGKAMDLLSNLMEWSLSQTGRINFNPEFFKIKELMHETNLLFSEIAAQKAIGISYEVLSEKDVYADKQMISTILRNLVSNAIKFTPIGGSIKIQGKQHQNKLLISVKDSGIGLSKRKIESIFTVKANSSEVGTQKEEGTGLGLILCKEFIERHNESIWVESFPDKGSTFYFTLPFTA